MIMMLPLSRENGSSGISSPEGSFFFFFPLMDLAVAGPPCWTSSSFRRCKMGKSAWDDE
jgi:hypothetical protein